MVTLFSDLHMHSCLSPCGSDDMTPANICGMAWTTVQTNMNVVAVAVLADMACIVLPEDIEMEKEVLEKAVGEGIVVLTSPLTSYEISGRMYGQGIPAHN